MYGLLIIISDPDGTVRSSEFLKFEHEAYRTKTVAALREQAKTVSYYINTVEIDHCV